MFTLLSTVSAATPSEPHVSAPNAATAGAYLAMLLNMMPPESRCLRRPKPSCKDWVGTRAIVLRCAAAAIRLSEASFSCSEAGIHEEKHKEGETFGAFRALAVERSPCVRSGRRAAQLQRGVRSAARHDGGSEHADQVARAIPAGALVPQ